MKWTHPAQKGRSLAVARSDQRLRGRRARSGRVPMRRYFCRWRLRRSPSSRPARLPWANSKNATRAKRISSRSLSVFFCQSISGDDRHLHRLGDSVHRKKQSITGDRCGDHGLFGQSIVQIKSKNQLEPTIDFPRIGLVFVLIEIRKSLAS